MKGLVGSTVQHGEQCAAYTHAQSHLSSVVRSQSGQARGYLSSGATYTFVCACVQVLYRALEAVPMLPTQRENAFQSMVASVSSVGAKQGFLGMQAMAHAQVSFVSEPGLGF